MAKIKLSKQQIENVIEAINHFSSASSDPAEIALAKAAAPAISRALNELSFGREAPMFEANHQTAFEE